MRKMLSLVFIIKIDPLIVAFNISKCISQSKQSLKVCNLNHDYNKLIIGMIKHNESFRLCS